MHLHWVLLSGPVRRCMHRGLFTWCYTMGSSGRCGLTETRVNYSIKANECKFTTGKVAPYMVSVGCCGGCDPLPGQPSL